MGKTLEILTGRLRLRLSMLTDEERQTLIDSLVFRQEARGPLAAENLHGANAVFMLDQGWTYALTKPYNQYRTWGQSSLMQIEAFSGPNSDVAQYHIIDIYSKREDGTTPGLCESSTSPLDESLASAVTRSLNDEMRGIPLSWKVPPRLSTPSERESSKVPLLIAGPGLQARSTLFSAVL